MGFSQAELRVRGGDDLYTGFSGELKAGTEVAATAKMPLLTPCPTYNQEAHKPVLPEKFRGREVMVGSGLKIEIMSVQDMGLHG